MTDPKFNQKVDNQFNRELKDYLDKRYGQEWCERCGSKVEDCECQEEEEDEQRKRK